MSARDDVLAALARDGVTLPAKWRVIITDSESPTGVAPVCTASTSWHMIDDYPGGPKYDEDGVYDCCPWPQFDTYSEATATYVVTLLNADAEPHQTTAEVRRADAARLLAELRPHISRAIFCDGITHAAGLLEQWADEREDATATATTATPTFFQPGHVYAHSVYRFRCEHLATHPVTGLTSAWGWFGKDDIWRHHSFGERQFQTREWTDVTRAGAS